MMIRRMFLAAMAWMAVGGAAAQAAANDPPVVLAAASLQESLTDAANQFAAKGHPKPILSFGGSSALARQIENGAPAQLFISADEAWMDYVDKKSLVEPGSRTSFLANRLVLIAPADKPFTLVIKPGFALAAALGDGKLSMADVSAVPAGKYGKAALTSLGVWPSVEGKIAQSDNVRSALAFVERGEAAAGIVYATDARASTKVKVVGVFPETSHEPISYPLGLIAGQAGPEAKAFRAYLLSRDGKAIFAKYGFIVK